MKITLELGEKDLRHFRATLKKVRKGSLSQDERVVMDAAGRMRDEAIASDPPEFVRVRIEKLGLLIRMLSDDDWKLRGADRARILNALAYFSDPDDIIPDKVPVLGYLDDAIMLELVVQDLHNEIEAYQDFCEFRRKRRNDPKALENRRRGLQNRMRRRRRKETEDLRGRAGGRSPFRLW